MDFSGHHVSAHGIWPLEEKVTAIHDFPQPTTMCKVHEFFGILISIIVSSPTVLPSYNPLIRYLAFLEPRHVTCHGTTKLELPLLPSKKPLLTTGPSQTTHSYVHHDGCLGLCSWSNSRLRIQGNQLDSSPGRYNQLRPDTVHLTESCNKAFRRRSCTY